MRQLFVTAMGPLLYFVLAVSAHALQADAGGASIALVTPSGFCVADGSNPNDAKVTSLFKKVFESVGGGKLLGLYRTCSSDATEGLVVFAYQPSGDLPAAAAVPDICSQWKQAVGGDLTDIEDVIKDVNKITKEELGKNFELQALKILAASEKDGACFVFAKPQAAVLTEAVLEILSYVPVRDRVIIVMRVFGLTKTSSSEASYAHLQQTIAALLSANR